MPRKTLGERRSSVRRGRGRVIETRGRNVTWELIALGVHALLIGDVIPPLCIPGRIRAFAGAHHAAGNQPRSSTTAGAVTPSAQGSSSSTDCGSYRGSTGKILGGRFITGLADRLLRVIAADLIFLDKYFKRFSGGRHYRNTWSAGGCRAS